MKKFGLIKALILCFIFFLSVSKRVPAATDISPTKKALLTLKVLQSDRNLKAKTAKTGNEVNVVLIHKDNNPKSKASLETMIKAFKEVSQKVTLMGMPINISSLAFKTGQDFEKALLNLKPVMIFLTPGLRDNLKEILTITKKNSILSSSYLQNYTDLGVSLCAGMKNGKPKLFINLPSSRSEGTKIPSAILNLAEVKK